MEQPSQTLYLNNLNEKIKKNILKKTLYALFSQFGKVIEIVACKGIKLRGQAWIVYQDITSATTAIRRLQGFNLYDKPLRIAFAKNKSDIIAKKDGTFVPREKRPRDESDDHGNNNSNSKERNSSTNGENNNNNNNNSSNSSKPKFLVNNVPHRILFAQNVPDECNDRMLAMLFQPFPGFQEVRMVPGKKGLAFIEFQDVIQAGIALQQLNGFQLTGNDTLQLTYAKQ